MKKKIRFYQSINTKIVFIIVMLLVFALQIIGANFITQIERQLVNNFEGDRQTQITFLESAILPLLEAYESDEDAETDPREQINDLLMEFSGSGITELQVIDTNMVVLGISDSTQQGMLGQISTDADVRSAHLNGDTVTRQVEDAASGRRWKIVEPIFSDAEEPEFLGVVLMESDIEDVYNQIAQITQIFLQSSAVAIVLSLILANMVSRALTKTN